MPLIAALGAAACDSPEPEPLSCPTLEPTAAEPGGELHQYVIDSITFPTTAVEAQELGLDLDRDPERRADNDFGQIISTFASVEDVQLNEEVEGRIISGDLLHLLQIRATSLTDANGIEITVAHATDTDGDPTDNFSGQEEFEIDPSGGIGTITGRIDDAVLSADVGTFPLRIILPGIGEPLEFRLFAVAIDATIDESRIRGRFAGALSTEDTRDTAIPVLHFLMSRVVDQDCDRGVCEPGSGGEDLLDLFDVDGNGALTLEELQNHDFVQSILSPDLDMLDENGVLSPRCDEVKDALSIGIGFTAVQASFPPQ